MTEEGEASTEQPQPEVPRRRRGGQPNQSSAAAEKGGLSLPLEPAKEEVMILVPPPKRGGFRFWSHKEYGLFIRETRQMPKLTQRFTKFMNQAEVESVLAEGFEDSKGYIFAEIDNSGQMKQVMWQKRQPRASVPTSNKPPWERLEDDLNEAIKPLESVSRVIERLRDLSETFGGGTAQTDTGATTEQNTEQDILAKGLEVQRKFYDNLFQSMSTSMGTAMSQMVMPWSIPQNFPQWAQMMMHPGFRQGLRETVKETIDDLTTTISDTVTGAAVRAQNQGQALELPSLSDLREKAKKILPKGKEKAPEPEPEPEDERKVQVQRVDTKKGDKA